MIAEKDAKILANVCWKRELCRDVPDRGVVKKPVILKSTLRSVFEPRSLQASLPQCRKNSEKYAASLTRDRTFHKRLSDFNGRLTLSLYAAPYYHEFISSACCVCKQAHLAQSCRPVKRSLFCEKVFKSLDYLNLESVIHENVPFPD